MTKLVSFAARKVLPAFAALLLFLCAPLAGASQLYSQLVVFGDSLSDSGVFHAQFGGLDPYTNYSGRFSDGPTAAERLAADLGLSASRFHNYAVGGSQTGSGNLAYSDPLILNDPVLAAKLAVADLPGLRDQATRYLSSTAVDPLALYLVWGGSNDFAPLFLLPSVSEDQLATTITLAVSNLVSIVADLISGGAQHVLVPNLPNLGLTPAASARGAEAAGQAAAVSVAFNAGYANALNQLDLLAPGVIARFDVFSAQSSIVEDPAAYGFANGTDGCLLSPSCLADPSLWDRYLYWDGQHPTAGGHAVLGDGFYAAVGGVPEPDSLSLFALTLLMGGIALRRRT